MPEVELAKATVYGLGLGRTSRRARLAVFWSDESQDAIICKHELQRRADHGLEWDEQDVLVVNPVETRDREVIEPGYSEFPDDRLVAEWNQHAARGYVRHERKQDRGWSEVRSWEVHPATGVEQVAGRGLSR